MARINNPQYIQKNFEILETKLVVEDRNKPKITNPEVANIINLTKLIGSKLWEGDTAKETAGPTKIMAQYILRTINSWFMCGF